MFEWGKGLICVYQEYIFVILLILRISFSMVFRWLMEKVEFVESRRWESFLNYRYFYSYFFIL